MVSSLIVRPEPQKFLKILLDLIFYGFFDRNDVGELIDFNMKDGFSARNMSVVHRRFCRLLVCFGGLPTREFFPLI